MLSGGYLNGSQEYGFHFLVSDQGKRLREKMLTGK